MAVYNYSVQTYAHDCVTVLQEEEEEEATTASVGNEKFSLEEYHTIKPLGKGGFGTVSLEERTPESCSGEKRDLFAMKCVRKRASKNAGSRRVVEKVVFEHSDGHPFLVQLHAHFQTMVLYSF